MSKQNSMKKDKDWFYWGQWNPNLLTVSLWHNAMTSPILKKMGVRLSGSMICIKGRYYCLKSDFAKLGKTISRQGYGWYEKVIKSTERETEKLLKASNDLAPFFDLLAGNYFGCLILIQFSDRFLEQSIKALCKRQKIDYTKLRPIIKPNRQTLLMKYNKELKKVPLKALDKFIRKWQWINSHAFDIKPLTKKDVEEAKRQKNQQQKLTVSRAVRIDASRELKRLIRIAGDFSFHRSNLVEQMNRLIYSYLPQLRKIAEKNNINYSQLTNLTFEEMLGLLSGKKTGKALPKRDKVFGYIAKPSGVEIVIGSELEEIASNFEKETVLIGKTIKGTIASPGRAKGKVKVVKTARDCEKVKAGDIMVAPETTPDFILAMGRAAAFVTDQGGLTSHAAIIAREMGKPCIIGAGNATRVLKDGDLVEVDAEQGVVNILKRKKL